MAESFILGFICTAVVLGLCILWYLEGRAPLEKNRMKSLLVDRAGVVKSECTPDKRGKVFVEGAYWDAVSQEGTLQEGNDIEVVGIDNKILIVRKVELVTLPNDCAEDPNVDTLRQL